MVSNLCYVWGATGDWEVKNPFSVSFSNLISILNGHPITNWKLTPSRDDKTFGSTNGVNRKLRAILVSCIKYCNYKFTKDVFLKVHSNEYTLVSFEMSLYLSSIQQRDFWRWWASYLEMILCNKDQFYSCSYLVNSQNNLE